MSESFSPVLVSNQYPRGLRFPNAGAAVLAGLCAGITACAGQTPGAPDDASLVTISGYVYAEGTVGAGEPALTEVLITVQGTDTAAHTTTTDGVGFYALSVRAGNISITASKPSKIDVAPAMPTGRMDARATARGTRVVLVT